MMLEACRYVDLVIPERTWEQKRDDVKKYDIDIVCMGSDWKVTKSSNAYATSAT